MCACGYRLDGKNSALSDPDDLEQYSAGKVYSQLEKKLIQILETSDEQKAIQLQTLLMMMSLSSQILIL